MKKPLIGIILDFEQQGEYSNFPYYVLRANYFDAIEKFGGVPLAIPYSLENIEKFSSMLDGLMIAGGNFDISPELYGVSQIHETIKTNQKRTDFEWRLTKSFLETGKPILGICGGMQLLNVILGGTLIQDIATEIPNALQHEVKDRLKPAHKVNVSKKTKLFEIVNSEIIETNTSHHQAVKNLGKNILRANEFVTNKGLKHYGNIKTIRVINAAFGVIYFF